MITQEQKYTDMREYTSLLLSLMLAVEFNRAKPNTALRETAKRVKERLTSSTVKKVCDNVCKARYPEGWLSAAKNRISGDGFSVDEFLSIGASL